jgi:hypothetical protein
VFTLSYPYSKRWRATVDTKTASAHRTNGYLIGVPLAGGRHQVELRYWSAPAVLGTVLSGLTLLGLVVFFAVRYTRRHQIRIPILAGGFLIIGGAYAAWYHSLYNGDNLETRYKWTSKQFATGDNIAFGRKARMSSTKSLERPYAFYAGLAVDGNRHQNGFATGLNKQRPWWEVDLGEEKALKEMVIYGATLSKVKAHLPLQLRVSNQRSGFRTVQELSTPPKGGPWRVELKGEKARFVRIQSSGKGSLSFKEVEIYEAD